MKNTLFLLMSLDGKISTGRFNTFDFDRDLADDPYLCKGLQQYYDIEKNSDEWSVISTKIARKLGAEEKQFPAHSVPVNYVVVGNSLNHVGKKHIADNCKSVVFVVTEQHAKNMCDKYFSAPNAEVLYLPDFDTQKMFDYLYNVRKAESVTVQTGGTLNRKFFADKVIDYVDIVVAPVIVGGQNTPTAVDGWDRKDWSANEFLTHLKLLDLVQLKENYVRMHYEVVK